jgi:hypothetical protein
MQNYLFLRKEKKVVEQIQAILQKHEQKYHHNLLNGQFKILHLFNFLQLVLLQDIEIEQHIEAIYFCLKHGADPNQKSGLGINFFHLFLILFFRKQSFVSEKRINLFIRLLNFNYIPNNYLIISPTKIVSLLDVLYMLQNKKDIIPKNFFPAKLMKEYYFCRLSQEYYDKLYIALLCYNEKFLTTKVGIHPIHNLTVYNLEDWKDNDFIISFIKNRYNLPQNAPIETLKESIMFLKENIEYIEDTLNKNDKPIGVDEEEEKQDITYVNTRFIENSYLQSSSYFPVIDNFGFHHSFFGENVRKGINPFTRQAFPEKVINSWMLDNNNTPMFPICLIEESISSFPFLFETVYEKKESVDTTIINSLFSFIESSFRINHPYNNIMKMIHFEQYQIEYVVHILRSETTLFPKFEYMKENNKMTLKYLAKILYYYSVKKPKYLNVLYFFLEEIISDMMTYNRVCRYIDDIESNYLEMMDAYIIRYNTNNNAFFNKFIYNMIKINDFKGKTPC